MTNESFSISELIPARPEQIYAAWMNSEEHTAFTGDAASVDDSVGGQHSAFNGYASGNNVELLPGRRIVQTWRTTQFPAESPDSRVEVTMEETVGGTMVTILHTEIPSGQSNTYRHSWEKYYLEPLKNYFRNHAAVPVTTEAEETVANRPVAQKAARKARKKAPTRSAKTSKPPVKKKAARRAKPARGAAKRRAKPRKVVTKARPKTRAAAKKAPAKGKKAPKRMSKKRRSTR